MKSIIIGLALICGSSAFAMNKAHKTAAKNCNPYIVANGEGPGEYVYPCGEHYTVTYRACNEGEVGYFNVGTSTMGDGSGYEEKRVCKNGSFYPPAKAVKHRGCNEGEIAYTNDTSTSTSEGSGPQVTIVCKNGKFVRAY